MENQENKISQEQLEELQGYVGKLNNAAAQIGNLELQKHQLNHAAAEVQQDLNKLQAKLEEKYGKVKIDIQTGRSCPKIKSAQNMNMASPVISAQVKRPKRTKNAFVNAKNKFALRVSVVNSTWLATTVIKTLICFAVLSCPLVIYSVAATSRV